MYKISAVLAAAVWSGAALAAPVTVLNAPVIAQAANPGNRAETRLAIGPYRTNALVLVTVSGESSHQGPAGNAGILVSILDGDRPLARDDSFDSRSSNITYRAAASHNFILPAGRRVLIRGVTEPYGSQAAANTGSSVTMTLVALSVQ
jgi:hypothetical protein